MVFGNGQGSAFADKEQISNKASTVENDHTSVKHWNSGVTSSASIYLQLTTPTIVKEIQLALRCAKRITIYGGMNKDDTNFILKEKFETGHSDNATYNNNCVKTYTIETSAIVSFVRIEIEGSCNVSLFWAKVF